MDFNFMVLALPVALITVHRVGALIPLILLGLLTFGLSLTYTGVSITGDIIPMPDVLGHGLNIFTVMVYLGLSLIYILHGKRLTS